MEVREKQDLLHICLIIVELSTLKKINKITENDAFEIAINAGAKDCSKIEEIYEIITEKEDFYRIKTTI